MTIEESPMYLDHCRIVLSNSSHSSNPLKRSLRQMTDYKSINTFKTQKFTRQIWDNLDFRI